MSIQRTAGGAVWQFEDRGALISLRSFTSVDRENSLRRDGLGQRLERSTSVHGVLSLFNLIPFLDVVQGRRNEVA